MKHGFVLMVVDHHPADDTVDSGPDDIPSVCVGHWLLLSGNHRTAVGGRRAVKAMRRGRELWDRREVASEEIRACGGALLGDHPLRLLSLLCLVWIKS